MTPEIIHIEPMTVEDLEEVLMIEEGAFPVPWSRSTFLTELSAPPFSCLCVARPAGQHPSPPRSTPLRPSGAPPWGEGTRSPVVGYVCCWVIADELRLLNLAVHPAHRRRGIGEALLRFALTRGSEQGATGAILEVRASNTTAQRLYARCGFHVLRYRPDYYSRPREDAVLMSCALVQPEGELRPEGEHGNVRHRTA